MNADDVDTIDERVGVERVKLVSTLRRLADDLEHLPLADAVEPLVVLHEPIKPLQDGALALSKPCVARARNVSVLQTNGGESRRMERAVSEEDRIHGDTGIGRTTQV